MRGQRRRSQRGFTLVEILVVIVIIGVLAIMGVSKYTEFTTTSRQTACGANQASIDKSVAVWEAKDSAIPTGAQAYMELNTNGVITKEIVLDGISAAVGNNLTVGNDVMAKITKDTNVFVCPERANNLGGIAAAHAAAATETHYHWEVDPTAQSYLAGKSRGTQCLKFGEPANGPDGTKATRHSGQLQ